MKREEKSETTILRRTPAAEYIAGLMGVIRTLLVKEFRQILRNRAMLPILFVMPVVQLLVLSFAATFEVRETPLALVDEDRTEESRRLVGKLQASGYFAVHGSYVSPERAETDLLTGDARAVLRIPAGMAADLAAGVPGNLQLIINAEDGATAGLLQSYAAQILADYNRERAGPVEMRGGIRVHPRHWFNPNLEYTTFMVPGILVLLVTMIGTFLSAMNVVREKEIGTIEQLNVTPIKRYQFITAKLLPFWLVGLIELGIGLVIAWLVFSIPMEGSLGLVFLLAGVYLVVMLAFGLWISTITETQQQAMFIAWFIMVVFILMSGLFTPIESMPPWAQWLTKLNPIAYFIEIMRRVLLKGADFGDVFPQARALVIYGAVMLFLAVRQYRKVSV